MRNRTLLLVVVFVAAILALHLLYLNPSTIRVSAQQLSCPAVVQKALDLVKQVCGNTGRSQACYGYKTAQAAPVSGHSLVFNNPGDKANLSDVQAVQLTPYNAATGVWGVATMNVQANLPGVPGGQFVTMLLMGDVQLTNGSPSGQPMQAFYLKGGIGAPGCDQMPASGVLLESPQGKQRVQLVANGVVLNIGSRAFLQVDQATSQKKLDVFTLEGRLVVTSDGKTQIVEAGQTVNIDLDDNYAAEGPPSDAVEGEPDNFEAMPVELIDELELEAEVIDGEATQAASESTEQVGEGAATPEVDATAAPDATDTDQTGVPDNQESTPPAPESTDTSP